MSSKSSYRNHWDRAVESLKECSKHAEEVDVCLAIENAVVCNFVDRPEELLKMVRQVGSDHVKVYLDLANANAFFPPVDYLETLRDSLCTCIHVSDNDGSYPAHLPIGMGTIDYRKCIDKLREIGWDGYLVPEVFYGKDPVAGVRKSKQALTGLLA
jgi:hexulose-6-phosphate isomerase